MTLVTLLILKVLKGHPQRIRRVEPVAKVLNMYLFLYSEDSDIFFLKITAYSLSILVLIYVSKIEGKSSKSFLFCWGGEVHKEFEVKIGGEIAVVNRMTQWEVDSWGRQSGN